MITKRKLKHIAAAGIGCLLLTACGNNEQDFDASGTFEATEVIVSAEANGKIMLLQKLMERLCS